jgi:hypothetical protein
MTATYSIGAYVLIAACLCWALATSNKGWR